MANTKIEKLAIRLAKNEKEWQKHIERRKNLENRLVPIQRKLDKNHQKCEFCFFVHNEILRKIEEIEEKTEVEE